MPLRKKGSYSYGDAQSDIREELASYSATNAYAIEHFADAKCVCGNATFVLFLDDAQGVALRNCLACKTRHYIGDGEEYLEDAELEGCECPCGADEFEISAGVALYAGSDDVKWFYLGCRCVACELVACYGDWKNEFEDYRELLANV